VRVSAYVCVRARARSASACVRGRGKGRERGRERERGRQGGRNERGWGNVHLEDRLLHYIRIHITPGTARAHACRRPRVNAAVWPRPRILRNGYCSLHCPRPLQTLGRCPMLLQRLHCASWRCSRGPRGPHGTAHLCALWMPSWPRCFTASANKRESFVY